MHINIIQQQYHLSSYMHHSNIFIFTSILSERRLGEDWEIFNKLKLSNT
jgi:hypothetical protein